MEAYWIDFIFVAGVILAMNFMAGIGVCTVLKKNITPAACELMGAALIGTYCELVTVPLVLLRAPFTVAAWFIVAGYALFDVLGIAALIRMIVKREKVERTDKKGDLAMGVLLYSAVIGLTAFVIYKSIALQHVDEDDTRFVVNAMDMVEHNTLFLTNPATGRVIDNWYGELLKDVVSPYSVFPAAVGYMTGMKAVTAYHSVMPIIFLAMLSCVYYELGERFFPGRRDYKSLFVIFLWIINIFGYYSVYGQETFVMTRLWQGKSVVAAIGIPATLMLLLDVFNDPKDWKAYVLLALVNASMCFFSGMGILLMAIMIMCFALAYTVAKKNPRIILFLGLTCIPNILCYVIHLGLKMWIIR
ncbi:MAG: DUF6077 domain-containing protein [Lachnospiraceae bacterium]|nr:DUF6077 domain-containing protein [Lachnospiraceae bacterium]